MDWVIVALMGGVVGLDSTAFAQVMISRPLVAAALTGLLLGDPLAGTQVGLALEAFSLVALPVGAARYPEGGTASVAAAAGFVVSNGSAAALLVAIGFGVLWEQVMGRSVLVTRQVNERLVRAEVLAPAGGADIQRRHLAAMLADFTRAATLTVVGGVIATYAIRVLSAHWPAHDGVALGMVTIAVAAMLGAMLPIFGGLIERKVAFVTGLAVGGLLWWLR